MSNPVATLQQMGEALRRAPRALELVMPKLQAATRQYLDECYARGVDPDGKPWAPTKSGGTPKLSGEQIEVVYNGTKIIIRARWYEALHSRGHARGGVVRSLIPSGGVPPELLRRWESLVEDALTEALSV